MTLKHLKTEIMEGEGLARIRDGLRLVDDETVWRAEGIPGTGSVVGITWLD